MTGEETNDERLALNATRRTALTTIGSGLIATSLSTTTTTAQQNGRRVWAFETDGAVSSPAVADGTVFIVSEDNYLYAVDANTGKQRWNYTASNIIGSPTVVDETVLAVSDNDRLLALDVNSGERMWRFEINNWAGSSPTVVDGTVYIGSGDTNLYLINFETGDREGNFKADDAIVTSPTIVDGTIIFGTEEGELYSIETIYSDDPVLRHFPNGIFSLTVVNEKIFVRDGEYNLHAVGTEPGPQFWEFESHNVYSKPIVAYGTVFIGGEPDNIGAESGYLFALDADTGQQQWSFKTDSRIDSSPAVVNGTVYVGSEDTNLYAVDAKNGEQQWAFETDGPINSSPAVLDETVYVGSEDTNLYAVKATRVEPSNTSTNATGDEPSNTSTNATGTEMSDSSGTESPPLFNPLITLAGGSAVVAPIFGYGIYRLIGSQQSESDSSQPTSTDTTTVSPEQGDRTESVRYTITSSIAEIKSNLKEAEQSIETKDFHSAREKLESVQAHITSTIENAMENNFNDLHSELIQLKQQREELLKETIQQDVSELSKSHKIPDPIPQVPNVSVNYEDLTEEEHIGGGGNADVAKATVTTSAGEMTLAIKEPRMAGTIQMDAVERMLEEAETWDKLDDHDHIVSVLDYGDTPIPWIAMEYMDAGHLGSKSGILDMPQALWTAIAVTKGVRHAHRRGVAHLDLKPENVLFRSVEDAWDVPKVADWGLSKHLLEHSKSVEGLSPQYAAPEQFDDGYGPADDITDIYQLGAVFYELFTEQPPFDGKPAKAMHKVLHEEPTPPSEIADVPQELDEILLTALAKEKDDRYDNVAYFRDELQKLSDNL